MAGPHTYYSLHHNLLPASKDELAGEAPIKGSSTPAPTSIPIVSCASTLASALTLNAIVASVPASTNKLFKQFMKTYLKAQTQTT